VASLRCPACSLSNLEGSTVCRRCGGALAAPSGSEVWRDGSVLVLKKGAALPDRCVRCNAAAPGSGFKKTFYWHPPALYLLVLPGLLIYAIVALAVRKSVTVFVCLCPEHRRTRRWAIAGSSLLAILGAVFLFVAIENGAFFGWSGLAMVLGGAIWGSVGARGLTPKRIDEQFARFSGACPELLQQLPSWSAFR
jgi:hypothetical protein